MIEISVLIKYLSEDIPLLMRNPETMSQFLIIKGVFVQWHFKYYSQVFPVSNGRGEPYSHPTTVTDTPIQQGTV